jgi:hypothetical protein
MLSFEGDEFSTKPSSPNNSNEETLIKGYFSFGEMFELDAKNFHSKKRSNFGTEEKKTFEIE